MNYKIVKNEKLLQEFIKSLPELTPDEIYYVALFARRKYSKTTKLPSENVQLKRFTSNKKYLFDKIKQLECEIGSYKDNGEPIPEETLALYINPNPRSLSKASTNLLIELAKKITQPNGYYNPHKLALNELQTAKSTARYFDFDIDGITKDELEIEIKDKINLDAINILQTNGGFHVLVIFDKIAPEYKNKWHVNLSSIKGCDVKGDNLMPVPGCTQGNFIPRFIKLGPRKYICDRCSHITLFDPKNVLDEEYHVPPSGCFGGDYYIHQSYYIKCVNCSRPLEVLLEDISLCLKPIPTTCESIKSGMTSIEIQEELQIKYFDEL